MRKFFTVSAAVAAALASSGAFALNEAQTAAPQIKLVVSGASAQRDTFAGELKKLCTGAGTDFDTYSASGGGDFRVYSCTLASSAANPNVPANIQNQRVAVYYRSEGGSVYGVGPLLSSNPRFASGVKRLVVNIAGAPCSNAGVTGDHSCPITGYNLTTDTDTTSPSRLVNDPTELGISDVEPAQFTGSNWATGSTLGAAPTPTQLNPLNAAATPTSGTVFGVLVSTSGPQSILTNITTEALTSIFSGKVTDWSKIDRGNGTALPAGAIRRCIREPGSGTQVAASIYMNGVGCSTGALPFIVGNGTTIIENSSSTAMNTCVAVANSIGFRNVGSNPTGAKFISVDGVAATKVNSALGRYRFQFEATAQRRSGLSGTKLALANALITFSQKAAALNTTPSDSAFALPTFNAPATFGKANNTTATVALGVRGKNSCKPVVQQN